MRTPYRTPAQAPPPEWKETGSVIMNTQGFEVEIGDLELKLERALSGSWKLSCESLWADAPVIVGPSSMPPDDAKAASVVMAMARVEELFRRLPLNVRA